MMDNEEIISLPDHLLEHNYSLPHVCENIQVDELVEEIEVEEENETEIIVVGLSETYTLIPGVHNKSRIYIDNLGFKYYKREIRGNRVYLVCERQKMRKVYCRCTAVISTDFKDNRIHLRNYHDHPPKKIDLNLPFLREAIGERGIDPVVTSFTKTLYDNEIMSYPEAALNYTFYQAQDRVRRMRCRRLHT